MSNSTPLDDLEAKILGAVDVLDRMAKMTEPSPQPANDAFKTNLTMLVDRLNAIQQTSHAMEDPIPYELIHRVVDEGGNPEDYLAELHRRAQFEHVGMSAKRQGFGQLEQLIRERAGALLPSESGGAADAPAAAAGAAAAAAAAANGGTGGPSAKAAGKRARGR